MITPPPPKIVKNSALGMTRNSYCPCGFENYATRWFSFFIVYLDLDSMILPVATAKNSSTISSTATLEQHYPRSYCMIIIERDNPGRLHFDIYTGPDCMERFVTKIEKLAKYSYHQKRKFPSFLGTAPPRERWSKCWICKADFNNYIENVLDHCHFNGQFIRYAHSACKLNYTPVIANNMMDYDLHHIVKSLHSASQSTKIEVIPTNDEKFIALNFGVFMETRKRKSDDLAVYEYLRFTDSF